MLTKQATITNPGGRKKKGRAQDIDVHIGEQLKKFRKMKSLTQKDLGNQLGISFQQVQKYENGKNRISFGRLYELSNLLQVPMESFVGTAETGLSDNDQAAISGYEDNNKLTQKETNELLKAYHSLKDPQRRTGFVKLVKDMAKNMKD